MPEILLNRAAFTRTTGTANPTLTGDPGKSGSMSTVPTGTQVAYVRRYSSNKPGFENCIGIWRAVAAAGSIGYIERTSVELSSNPGDDDNEAVVWGVGEQTVDVTITPDMIVADDDERLLTVAPGELGTVATITGGEKWIAEQGGDGIDITSEQVLGTPFIQNSGHGTIKYLREYTDFRRIRPAFASSTGGTLDLEPYLITQNGSGAGASQLSSVSIFSPLYRTSGLLLTTGSTDTGYVVCEHLLGPLLFVNGTSNYDFRAEVLLETLPTSGEDYTFSAGFFLIGTAPATTQFIGLTASYGGGGEWASMVKNAAGQTTPANVDVATQTSSSVVLRAWYDGDTAKSRFFINGTEAPSITDAARALTPFSLVRPGFILKKTAGTTARRVAILRHSLNIKLAAIPYF